MIFSIHLEKLKQKYNKKKGLTAAMLSVPRSQKWRNASMGLKQKRETLV